MSITTAARAMGRKKWRILEPEPSAAASHCDLYVADPDHAAGWILAIRGSGTDWLVLSPVRNWTFHRAFDHGDGHHVLSSGSRSCRSAHDVPAGVRLLWRLHVHCSRNPIQGIFYDPLWTQAYLVSPGDLDYEQCPNARSPSLDRGRGAN